MMFSKNTPGGRKVEILNELGATGEARNEKYLELPVYIGRSKTKESEYIKQRVWSRIRGWQEKLL